MLFFEDLDAKYLQRSLKGLRGSRDFVFSVVYLVCETTIINLLVVCFVVSPYKKFSDIVEFDIASAQLIAH